MAIRALENRLAGDKNVRLPSPQYLHAFAWVVALVFLSIQSKPTFAAVEVATQFSASLNQYAPDAHPEALFKGAFSMSSDDRNSLGYRVWHTQFEGFYETGKQGDWNFDTGPLVWRRGISDSSYLWLGRTIPWTEAHDPYLKASTKTALGNLWVQNQTSALDPKVSGWLSLGFATFSDSGFFGTAAASPLFLPTFGPSLTLSESAPSSGARFSVAPPQFYEINGGLIPLRYKIEVGEISKIIFQPQAYASFGQVQKALLWQVFAWSAPSPSPEVDPEGSLVVNDTDANVLVTAKPKFLRESFVGGELHLKKALFSPRLQLVQEVSGKSTSGSLEISPFEQITTGFLHKFQEKGDPDVSTMPYSDRLFWIEGQVKLSASDWSALLRYETHFSKGIFVSDAYLKPQVIYRPNSWLSTSLAANFLFGKEGTYFGNWRQYDSVGFEMEAAW